MFEDMGIGALTNRLVGCAPANRDGTADGCRSGDGRKRYREAVWFGMLLDVDSDAGL